MHSGSSNRAAQRALIAEHGPYTLSKKGAVLDCNGVALATVRVCDAYEECDWDRAVVAALNEITEAHDAR